MKLVASLLKLSDNIPINAMRLLNKKNNMKNLPEKIYLQIGEESDIDDIDFNELVGVSWCSDKIEESDVEFVRSDIARNVAKEFALFAVQNAKRGTENECDELFTEYKSSRMAQKAEE